MTENSYVYHSFEVRMNGEGQILITLRGNDGAVPFVQDAIFDPDDEDLVETLSTYFTDVWYPNPQ